MAQADMGAPMRDRNRRAEADSRAEDTPVVDSREADTQALKWEAEAHTPEPGSRPSLRQKESPRASAAVWRREAESGPPARAAREQRPAGRQPAERQPEERRQDAASSPVAGEEAQPGYCEPGREALPPARPPPPRSSDNPYTMGEPQCCTLGRSN
jgi:hypothetical protein